MVLLCFGGRDIVTALYNSGNGLAYINWPGQLKKVAGVLEANTKKVAGVADANINKIGGKTK